MDLSNSGGFQEKEKAQRGIPGGVYPAGCPGTDRRRNSNSLRLHLLNFVTLRLLFRLRLLNVVWAGPVLIF